MTVAFLGLTGTQGVLPFCYTEHMVARAAAKPADIRSPHFWIFLIIGCCLFLPGVGEASSRRAL